MKRRTAWILVASVALVAVGAAAVGAVALFLRQGPRGGAPVLGGNTSLTIDVQGEIPEAPPQELGAFFERRPPSLKTLVESLDHAARARRSRASCFGWAT